MKDITNTSLETFFANDMDQALLKGELKVMAERIIVKNVTAFSKAHTTVHLDHEHYKASKAKSKL